MQPLFCSTKDAQSRPPRPPQQTPGARRVVAMSPVGTESMSCIRPLQAQPESSASPSRAESDSSSSRCSCSYGFWSRVGCFCFHFRSRSCCLLHSTSMLGLVLVSREAVRLNQEANVPNVWPGGTKTILKAPKLFKPPCRVEELHGLWANTEIPVGTPQKTHLISNWLCMALLFHASKVQSSICASKFTQWVHNRAPKAPRPLHTSEKLTAAVSLVQMTPAAVLLP